MKPLLTHKRAKFDYEILETHEAGLVLFGHEVKSLRAGKGKLEGAHVIIRGNEAFVVGMNINPYQAGNVPKDYEQERVRKLLLSEKEIAELSHQSDQKGLTIVPLSVYNKGRSVKMAIAIVRGKKTRDKRGVIKERETKRTIERTLKNQY